MKNENKEDVLVKKISKYHEVNIKKGEKLREYLEENEVSKSTIIRIAFSVLSDCAEMFQQDDFPWKESINWEKLDVEGMKKAMSTLNGIYMVVELMAKDILSTSGLLDAGYHPKDMGSIIELVTNTAIEVVCPGEGKTKH
jgi:chorismate mutase